MAKTSSKYVSNDRSIIVTTEKTGTHITTYNQFGEERYYRNVTSNTLDRVRKLFDDFGFEFDYYLSLNFMQVWANFPEVING